MTSRKKTKEPSGIHFAVVTLLLTIFHWKNIEYANAKPHLLPETSNIAGQNRWFILEIRRVNGDTRVCQIKSVSGCSVTLIMCGEEGARWGFWSDSKACSFFQGCHWNKGALVSFCAPRKGGFKEKEKRHETWLQTHKTASKKENLSSFLFI